MLAIVVVFLFCLLYTAAIVAQTKGTTGKGKPSPDINFGSVESDHRMLVQSLGFGKRVDVKLNNGSKAGGRITGLAVEQFVVTDSKGTPTSISYSDVTRITKQKEKLGLFHKPWIGIMFTAAGLGTLIVLALAWVD